MKYIFNTIGLIGKFGDPGVEETLSNLIGFLRRRDLRILFDESSAELIHPRGLEVANRRTIGRQCDLAIVVGGDGTLLNTARTLVDFHVPILGVNLGRLGFLVDVSPAEIDQELDEILTGRYSEDRRSLLHAEILRDRQPVTQADALNDVVVHKSEVARMIEVEAFLDGRFITAYRADGLIISTPTGSTAYALSSGGPIIHPSLETILLVPICPHTLTQRPLLLSAEGAVELHVGTGNTTEMLVTCDGQVSLEIRPGDRVRIRQKRRKLRLIHPVSHDYFQILRAKLHWGMRPENNGG
ncbi:MAG: NAD(+) kinase [Candidatus Competibacterales bacterium]|nr:NAD(+) kinase [Candidatus Competibacterales bacterium]